MDRENNKGYRNFRNSLDLGMGVFYVIIGVLILYVKYFGTLELSQGTAYALGGLVVLYGLFRIYRGISNFRKIKQED